MTFHAIAVAVLLMVAFLGLCKMLGSRSRNDQQVFESVEGLALSGFDPGTRDYGDGPYGRLV